MKRAQVPLEIYCTPERRTTTALELFFDLVFVVAVSALGELLYEDHSLTGTLTVAGLFVPVAVSLGRSRAA